MDVHLVVVEMEIGFMVEWADCVVDFVLFISVKINIIDD